MKKAISLLNEMKSEGVIEDYAIGGATGLVYYFEPIQTQDVDVFVVLKETGSLLITLTPIYDFLRARGGVERGEYIFIGSIPLQFLLPYNPLIEESVRQGIYVPFGEIQVRILPLEYLMAIMVQTGRTKDRARLEDIYRLRLHYDASLLESILLRHRLLDRWQKITSETGDARS
ncbi:MAG: hypothetical protein IT210_18945 [Armatimonadetes bacterium]|nr:hypothetical protein [Armatimonadota bacterium]